MFDGPYPHLSSPTSHHPRLPSLDLGDANPFGPESMPGLVRTAGSSSLPPRKAVVVTPPTTAPTDSDRDLPSDPAASLPPPNPLGVHPVTNGIGQAQPIPVRPQLMDRRGSSGESGHPPDGAVVTKPTTPAAETTPDRPKMSRWREIGFIILIAASHLMTQAALGQALAPLDIIGAGLGARSIGETAWFVAAYSLTVGTFILVSGRLGDLFGHFLVYVLGWVWFGVWSAITGFSAYPQSHIFFDLCRAFQGIGPALLMPNGLALLGRAYAPGKKKNIAFSVFGGLAPAGFVIGAISGSGWASGVWWPWAFWTFSFACFGLAIVSRLIVPRWLRSRQRKDPSELDSGSDRSGPGPPRTKIRFPDTESDIGRPVSHSRPRHGHRDESRRRSTRSPSWLSRLDLIGAFTGVLGLVFVNVAWNNGPVFGWQAEHVVFSLVLGLVLLAWFGYVQTISRYPLLPRTALTATSGFVIGSVAIGWSAFGIWVFYMFRFLQQVRGESAIVSALHFLPAVPAGMVAAGLTGLLLSKAPVSVTMVCAMVAFFVGIVLAATMPARQSFWAQAFVSVLIMPFGMDMSFPAGSIILSNSMPAHQQGLAMSLVNTAVNYSISIALGIAGTVESRVVAKAIKAGRKPAATLLLGFRSAFYTAVALSGLGLVLAIVYFLRDMQSRRWSLKPGPH